MENFKKVDVQTLHIDPINAIGKDWMLITAGKEGVYNTMTASWGGLGVLWNKNVAFAFIRPQRYTMEFAENNDYFSLCFFDEDYRKALTFCGRNSGRDCDKAKETGLTASFEHEAPCFEQARLVLICKKMYAQYLTPECVIDERVYNEYKNNDYHKMFIGEIIGAYVKE